MVPVPGSEVTEILRQLADGDVTAESRLMSLVYVELRRLAASYMRKERVGHTLQPTALVNEAYVRLTKMQNVRWNDRAHFFATAARVMRRILVDYARANMSQKRGAASGALPIEELVIASVGRSSDFLALNEALDKLAVMDPRQCKIVELRFFGGLSDEEAASLLNLSSRTVKREWRIAKAWLYRELKS